MPLMIIIITITAKIIIAEILLKFCDSKDIIVLV